LRRRTKNTLQGFGLDSRKFHTNMQELGPGQRDARRYLTHTGYVSPKDDADHNFSI